MAPMCVSVALVDFMIQRRTTKRFRTCLVRLSSAQRSRIIRSWLDILICNKNEAHMRLHRLGERVRFCDPAFYSQISRQSAPVLFPKERVYGPKKHSFLESGITKRSPTEAGIVLTQMHLVLQKFSVRVVDHDLPRRLSRGDRLGQGGFVYQQTSVLMP